MRSITLSIVIFCVLFVYYAIGKPIKKEKEEQEDPKKKEEDEYLRYLGQVRY